jgi:hypothetical protein
MLFLQVWANCLYAIAFKQRLNLWLASTEMQVEGHGVLAVAF